MKEKILNREILMYLIFGVLTTLVYFVIRFTALNLGAGNIPAMILANIVSIIFAFFTNKLFVFLDKNSEKSIWVQFVQFASARLSGLAIDFLITLLCIQIGASFFIRIFGFYRIDFSHGIFAMTPFNAFIGSAELLNTFVWTMFIQVIVIVLNYLISKFIVFKKV